MTLFRALLRMIILIALSACALINPRISTPVPSSGIEGTVTLGPVCPGPVSVGDLNCHDKPYQSKISVIDSSGQLVTRFDTDEQGNFKISLLPGTYTLQPDQGEPFPVASDLSVVVIENQYTPVSIQYDTGIR